MPLWILVIIAGVAAYANSLAGPFIFDDIMWIAENPHIRRLWPLWDVLLSAPQPQVAVRPMLTLSLALNYAAGRLDVRGYHAVNVAIHVLAALVLCGIVRRTLLTAPSPPRLRPAAPWLALAVALLWVVHPLQTESVTYLIQRAESLMGLCYLLTLYGAIRGAASAAPWRWYAVSAICCAAGIATKPVMVTAPLLVLLYDRIFLSASVRTAWRARRGLYLGLAASWILLAGLVVLALQRKDPTIGLELKAVTPLQYLLTQPGVIAHYLRLAVWPHPLILDYTWPLADTAAAIVPPLLLVGALVLATGWALRHRPALGFLGAWCFLILMPTSSVLPIADVVVEHRMYLPLAGIIVLVVLAVDHLLRRLVRSDLARRTLATLLLVGVASGLGVLTHRRNHDYRSEEAIWRAVLVHQPATARAVNNLGLAIAQQGRLDEGIEQFKRAIELDPRWIVTYNNLGLALVKQGRLAEGIETYTTGLRLAPGYVKLRNNLGVALMKQGRLAEAVPHFTEALRLDPHFADARLNLDLAQERLQRR